MKESVKWGDIQEIETVGGLNRNITSGDVQETVLVQEAMQERRIAEIAQMIASRPEIRFVLIAGPSSSGKTTFHTDCLYSFVQMECVLIRSQ